MPRLVKQHSPLPEYEFATDIFPFEDHFQIAIGRHKTTSRWDASGTSASSDATSTWYVMPPVPVRDKLHPSPADAIQRFRHSLTQGTFPCTAWAIKVITGAIAVIFISLKQAYR